MGGSTTLAKPLTWLPFEPSKLSRPPSGLRYESVDLAGGVPSSADEVEVYVLPAQVGERELDVIARLTSLRLVQTLTAGVDLVRDVVPSHVTLCNGRGIHDASTAELAVTLTLSALRGVPQFVRDQEQRQWSTVWHTALADSRVLLIGYGAIGAAIEARLIPFECEIVRVARRPRPGVHGWDDLPRLLPDADVVVLVVPLTSETRGLVDREFLGRMKSGALLVNVARGAVVVTQDLVAAMRAGRVRAALDVVDPEPLPPEHSLFDVPGLLLTPHIGGATDAMWPRAYELVADQLRRFVSGEPLANVLTGEY